MMFNKIALITSLLFFLVGTIVFADSRIEVSSPQNNSVVSQTAQMAALTSDNNKIVSANKSTATENEQAKLAQKQLAPAQPTLKSYVVPGLVGLLIIIGFGGYWLIYRQKYTSQTKEQ
ncbi:hypothetical protein M3610_11405 [Neobacillus sp. MER 74]|uniref:hypothetical protein n=2 Tax=unclassified Neobacillus TaxID=2675272 RepID=UPI00203AA09B|nr:hypothetical protein [Neobacillus sp. MER 74]MCM3115898.1 hypothetical protein [Neobacillus sp. MER 74]